MDGEVSRQFQRMLEKQGIEFKMSAKVTGIEKSGKGAKITFEPVKGGEAQTIDADVGARLDGPQTIYGRRWV